MPGGLTLLASLNADIPTPAAGKATIFFSLTSGVPSYKNDAGTVLPLGTTGATGPQGATGSVGPAIPLLYETNEIEPMIVAGPQGVAGSTAFVKIEEQTPSGVAFVTFASLGSFTNLRILFNARGDQAAVATALNMIFNADSSAIYDRESNVSGATTNTASESLAQTAISAAGLATGSTAPAGVSGSGEILIYDYRNTTYQKRGNSLVSIQQSTVTANTLLRVSSFGWRSTVAINSITITLASGNFVAGSKFSLYGMT